MKGYGDENYWMERAQRAEAVLWYILEWIGDDVLPRGMQKKAWRVAHGGAKSKNPEGNSWGIMNDPDATPPPESEPTNSANPTRPDGGRFNAHPTPEQTAVDPESGLKPCPFCGGRAILKTGEECAIAQCLAMSAHRLIVDGDNDAANEVTQMWNMRPTPEQTGAEKYEHLGDLSAVEPWHRVPMACDRCRVSWEGCWDNYQCPRCGEGELPWNPDPSDDAHPTPEQTESDPHAEIDYWSRGHSMAKRAAEQTEGMVEPPHDVLQSALRRTGRKVYPPEQTDDSDLTAAYVAGLERGRGENGQNGDALAALDTLIAEARKDSPGFPGHISAAAKAESIVRQALTASGVPYVPDCINTLMEEWEQRADMLDTFPSSRHGVMARTLRECAAELRAPASAPADGWKLVPVEPTIEMTVAGGQEGAVADVYRAMIASAPTHGGRE